MNVQVKRALVGYSFFVPQKTKKSDTLNMEFATTTICKRAAGTSAPYLKINAPYSVTPYF